MLHQIRYYWRKFKIMRHPTTDREATPIHTVEQIGLKRARTPEGYLLCMDVPIARSGLMLYGPDETPIKVGPDGVARVYRDVSQLANPVTLASFNGKPVVNDHPVGEFVAPENWKKYSIGVTLNPTMGSGENSDCIVADLLITDKQAIEDVEAGKREVSAGYDADYEQTGEGEGEQTNIIGNHIALVERGRCGPRCAIGDHQPTSLKEHSAMPIDTKKRRVSLDAEVEARVRKTFSEATDAALAALNGEQTGGDETTGATHIHIHTGGRTRDADEEIEKKDEKPTMDAAIEERFQKIEENQAKTADALTKIGDSLAELLKGKTGDSEGEKEKEKDEVKTTDGLPAEVEAAMQGKTGDSIALETSFAAVIADAEVLVPGFQFPTFDAKQPRRATMDAMCSLRRKVIGHMSATADGRNMLATLGAGFDLTKIEAATCSEVATLFRSAAAAKRLLNNAAGTRDASHLPVQQGIAPKGRVTSIAELNKLHAEIYKTAGAPH